MHEKLLKLLPWTALIGGVFAIASLILMTILHSGLIEENLENRSEAIKALKKIQTLQPEKINDFALKSQIEDTLNSQYIATVWLISSEGKILFSKGSTAHSLNTGLVREYASVEIQEILNSIPPDKLRDNQRVLLLAASAIQRERTHNDIYNHLIREVHSPDDTLVGYIGVAYELRSDHGNVSPGWIISVLVVLFCFPIYWLSIPLWVYLDARNRGERAILWGIFVIFGNIVALLAYLIARLPIKDPSFSD